jgi:3-hydroxybutyryl-CoA dehydratase
MKGLRLGQAAEIRRTFSAADVAAYQALSSDAGLAFATAGPDQVPGPLLGGLISALLGTRLPGQGTNWLKQRYHFPKAARLDEPVTARVEIVRLRPEKMLVNLRTTCTNGAGDLVCEGEALVLVADLVGRDPEREEAPMA